MAKHRRKRSTNCKTGISSEASGVSSSGSTASGTSSTISSEESNEDVEACVSFEETPKMAKANVTVCVLAGSPLAHGRALCRVRVELWKEAHRSAVSICRRGDRLASDLVFVGCALKFGGAHRSVCVGVDGNFS